jgi:hypothetical protein
MLVPNDRGPLFTISPLPHSMGLVNDVMTPAVEPYTNQIGRTSAFWKAGLQGLGGCGSDSGNCGCGCSGMGGTDPIGSQNLLDQLTSPPSLGAPLKLALWIGGSLLAARFLSRK